MTCGYTAARESRFSPRAGLIYSRPLSHSRKRGMNQKKAVQHRRTAFFLVATTAVRANYAEKEEPQPQVEFAFGLRMTNCEPSRPSE